MVSGKTIFPQAVTVSSGSSGVSAPFSVLPEKWAEQTGVLGQAVIQLMASPPGAQKDAAEAVTQRIAESLGQIYQDANSSAQSIQAVMTEAVRLNVEHTLRFFEDFASVQGPADAIGLQFRYMGAQMKLFADQSQALQRKLAQSFLLGGKR